MAFLSVMQFGKELQRLNITKKLVTIGRSGSCDLVLPDPEISSLHSTIIESFDGIYRLVDPGSTNGVFVNGSRIQEHELTNSDTIKMGNFEVQFFSKDHSDDNESVLPNEDYIGISQALLTELKSEVDSASAKTLKKTLDELEKALDDAHKAHDRLTPLLRMAEQANSAKGLDTALSALIEIALKAIGMERGAVLLLDDDRKPVIQAAIGFEKDAISMSVVEKALVTNEPVILSNIDDSEELRDAASIVAQNIRATVCLPLRSRTSKMIGALYLDTRLTAISKAELSPEYLKLFGLFAATTVQTRQLSQREKELEGSLLLIKEHERHEREQKLIDDERAGIAAVARKGRLDTMLGRSTVIDKLYSFIDKVAPTDVSVLITGETGTGKGVAARAIHELSNRKLKPFITIDCASIPKELLESELFGYEKGAFTGAVAQKKGRIEMAEEGTLFLDEIGDMSLGLQAKLLRFLQERSFERVGGNKTILVNVRVIAATNKELKSAVANKSFREDLYYRLCGVQLHVPPLRERGDDAYVLAVKFLDEIILDNNLPVKGFSPEAKNAILSYSWQGNIRQLKNVISRAAILCPGDHVGLDDLGFEPGHGGSGIGTLKEAREEADKRVIQQHLLINRRNLSKTARTLDIDRGTLRELMKRYGIAEIEES
jgi:transcriptional regulator with GAF, ATPase, and Fis domain